MNCGFCKKDNELYEYFQYGDVTIFDLPNWALETLASYQNPTDNIAERPWTDIVTREGCKLKIYYGDYFMCDKSKVVSICDINEFDKNYKKVDDTP